MDLRSWLSALGGAPAGGAAYGMAAPPVPNAQPMGLAVPPMARGTKLSAEMDYDGSHPRQQEQAARDHFRSYGPNMLMDALIPGYGAGGDAKAASEAFGEGRYGAAALNAGMAALDFVPGLGIFAGAASKAADMAKLARAERMAGQGADRRAIWDETGWFQGADGKWRYEIDDSGAGLSDYAEGALAGGADRQGLYPGMVSHPELYAAYPEMASPSQGQIVVGKYPFSSGGFERETGNIGVKATDVGDARSIALHELGHAVQSKEGFAPGSSPSGVTSELLAERNALLKSISKKMDDREKTLGIYGGYRPRTSDPELWALREQYDSLVGQSVSEREVYDRYRRTAGEVEARNIQTRRDMTPEQRRASPPWETEDVPVKDQIVRFLSK